GSSGRLSEILNNVPLVEGGRIVITAVTLETMSRGLQLLKDYHYQEIEVVSIQAVRWQAVENLHMAQALNPVFILSARKEGKS
ncbi:MAG: bifunctional cobalt-precorrin-7 (C(5))-methyltransferase/cobalt-precorrin-6B (C(15))-methyltransferase, partial [Bacillota bacterium]|nr:bifunctional cobalt-precorrin-7 (C(5))-methyltransferase/cobalt-precorrin-6B (C(15))-methyltransferase [Bacillota bacterium]